MKKVILAILSAGLIISFACGKKSQSSDDSSANKPTELSAVPGATTPVTTSIGGNLTAIADATNGVKIPTLTLEPFMAVPQAERSRAACESLGMIKEVYGMAVSPDKIKCYVSTMQKFKPAGVPDVRTNGDMNYWQIAEEGMTGSVKFKITKTDSGHITNFEMWECMGEGERTANNSYFKVDLSTEAVLIDMIMNHAGEWGTFAQTLSVNGTLGSDGKYTSKYTTATRTSAFETQQFQGSNYGKVNIHEYADAYKIDFFMKDRGMGTWTDWSGGTAWFSNVNQVRAYGIIKSINKTGKMEDMAAGNGTLHAIISGKNKSSNSGALGLNGADACTESNGEGGCYVQNEDIVEGWGGDTLAVVAPNTNSYAYDEVKNSGPMAAFEPPTIEKSADQTWDCSTIDTAAAAKGYKMESYTIDATLQAELAKCDQQFAFGDGGGSHINCWQMEDRSQ